MGKVGQPTVIDIQNQQFLSLARGMDNIDLQGLCCFLNLADIPGIMLIAVACDHVLRKVDIEVIYDVGQISELWKVYNIISCKHDVIVQNQNQREGSLISSPSGVPMRVNFFPDIMRISELSMHCGSSWDGGAWCNGKDGPTHIGV